MTVGHRYFTMKNNNTSITIPVFLKKLSIIIFPKHPKKLVDHLVPTTNRLKRKVVYETKNYFLVHMHNIILDVLCF